MTKTDEFRSENDQIGSMLFDEDRQRLSRLEHEGAYEQTAAGEVERGLVTFYFCLKGEPVFAFGPYYQRTLPEGHTFLMYNPNESVRFQLKLTSETQLVNLQLPLDSLHRIFVHDTVSAPFLSSENANRKFYEEKETQPELLIVLKQLFSGRRSDHAGNLYFRAKFYEILSLHFSSGRPDMESCPFLKDEESVRRLKQAKEFLLQHLSEAPTISELSKKVGLSESKLKNGFREVYGNTLHQFVQEHRLAQAKALLDTAKYRVSEVADRIGYANRSHFISAFKKKYGITPKQYLLKGGP
jgi:AraC-like DNA-binding protein